MRDESYFSSVDVTPKAAGRARWATAAGALLSVAALALVVVWAYRLGMRDAQSVPVIRAVEGPAKIRPEDPGGARFDHQGRTVYDALREAPAQTAEAALAPEPEPLIAEDRSAAEIAAEIEAAAARQAAEEQAALAQAAEAADALSAQIDAMVADVVGEATPEAVAPVQVALVDPTARAPVRSPVAPPRPGASSAAPAASAEPASETVSEAPAETDPEVAIAVDGPQIQLGAYLSEETALSMWSAIARRNGDLFAGRDPVLGAVRQGGQDLVLLRVGPFESGAQALDLCQRMRARDEDCLTVGAR